MLWHKVSPLFVLYEILENEQPKRLLIKLLMETGIQNKYFFKVLVLNACYDNMSIEQKKQVQESPKSVLRELREKTGLSQEQLAVQLGVSASTWRRWENTGVEPSMTKHQWRMFCSKVGVSFDQLPDYLSVPVQGFA